jgi:hypothetical protein
MDSPMNASTVSSESPKNAPVQRGEGELHSDLLTPPTGLRDVTGRDIGLMRRAVRERWPVDDKMRAAIMERMGKIISKPAVQVMTASGKQILDGPADSNAVRAAGVIVAMVQQNQADDHLAEKNARIDAGLATENIQVAPTIIRRPIHDH